MIILPIALAAVAPSNDFKASVEGAVRQQLKDPESARFKWPLVSNSYYYCGFVNSKNSYGGYVGFVPFYVDVHQDSSGKYRTGTAQVMSPWSIKDDSYSKIESMCRLDYDIHNEPAG